MPIGPIRPAHKLPPEHEGLRNSTLASLADFCEFYDPKYRAAEVHRDLCAVLELVEQGVIRRVCVNRQDNWKTNAGGVYFATNVGGAGVGRGADILLIDDVFRDRAHARSAAARKAVWEWFTSVAMTRLSPNGVALVIGTRWHREDLIGNGCSRKTRSWNTPTGRQSAAASQSRASLPGRWRSMSWSRRSTGECR